MSTKATYKELTLQQAAGTVMLGVAAAYAHPVISVLWLFVILFTIYGFLKDRMQWLWYGVAASPMLEVLARMSRAPFIPHEIGKYYLLLVIALLFIHHTARRSDYAVHHLGIMLLLCLLPSTIVGLSTFSFEEWVMNVLSILELGILLLFVARERWSVDEFCCVLRFALLPSILVLIYLTVNTPDFEKLNFALNSNFKTSGDFGSNQVSTILGLGMVLTLLLVLLKRPLFKPVWLNYVLLCLLLFRGFLTFSRGGMLAAILAIAIALLPQALSNTRTFVRYSLVVLFFTGVSALVFLEVNKLTGNQLLLRYRGETAGTIAGSKQRNINTITSHRLEIAETDWSIFKDNIVFGVGPGQSQGLRPQYGFMAIAPHTEYSRLLSEHGLGGVLTIILLFSFPIWWVRRQKLVTWRAVSGALFAIALLTSVHSAMRTNTTVVCYLLAAMPLYFIKGKKKTGNN